jgi:sugar phosphate permease
MDLADNSHRLRWSIVSLLFAASLINYLDRAAISFALPFISRDFHLTAQGKGLLLSSFFWSYAPQLTCCTWYHGRGPKGFKSLPHRSCLRPEMF